MHTLKVHVTEHAVERARERLSLGESSIEKLAIRAFKLGIRRKDTAGKFRKYLDHIDKEVRVYGEIVYVYSVYKKSPSLITVYQLPTEFKRYLKTA